MYVNKSQYVIEFLTSRGMNVTSCAIKFSWEKEGIFGYFPYKQNIFRVKDNVRAQCESIAFINHLDIPTTLI